MSDTYKKEHILPQKIAFTFIILVIYLFGRSVPLYGIDISAISKKGTDAELLFQQTIGGDLYRCSIFALGITPYMISSLLVQIVTALKSKEKKKLVSRIRNNRITVELMLFLALFQGILQVQKLDFLVAENVLFFIQVLCVLQMVAGVVLILVLSKSNKRYGIGGQTVFFLTNIVDGFMKSVEGHSKEELMLPLLLGVLAMIEACAMELNVRKISVQRISIHNIYADQNYLAIKMNPIGIMPVMFSTAFFMLPQLLVVALLYFFPQNEAFLWLQNNTIMTKPFGIAVYILILYSLTIFFARVMINPKEMTENFLKSGDSLENLHPGKQTRRFLSKQVTKLSFFGATVMAICIAVPIILSYRGSIESSLMMIPASMMMLSGMGCSMFQEIRAIYHSDKYRMFI